METLSKDSIPKALENNEFESRHIKNISWTFSHVQPINFPIEGTQSELLPLKKPFETVD